MSTDKQKTIDYYVIPRTNTGGKFIEAPRIYVTSNSKTDARDQAKQRSGLGRFENWTFHVFKL